MARLTYKCNLAKDKRPQWIKTIISGLHNVWGKELKGDGSDFNEIKPGIDRLIYNMKATGAIKKTSEVCTELVFDYSNSVLFVKRNGTPLLSIYIK